MRNSETISLVIPAFNACQVLDTSLASVAAQTRLPDEVVVVDDGSTDGTSAVAERWANRLPLRVLRFDENIGAGLGAGAARHEGIIASSGSVIALLDADDVMLPDHLELMVGLHERVGGLITADHLMWIPGEAVSTRPASELVPVPPPDRQWETIISENFVFVATVFSRSLYDVAGGFRSIRCEDWDLWIRMVESGATVHAPGQVTALYRGSSGSVSAGDRLLVGDVDLLTELSERLGPGDREISRRALRRRVAKQHFLRGVELYRSGRAVAARRAWIRAFLTDPSLRRNNSRLSGRVSVRAIAFAVLPGPMVRWRSARQASPQVLVGNT